jgi:hypothetical protein
LASFAGFLSSFVEAAEGAEGAEAAKRIFLAPSAGTLAVSGSESKE